MIEIIGSLVEGILLSIPSRGNRKIIKRIKLLQKELWYRKLLDRHGTIIHINKSVRHLIGHSDIESIIHDSKKLKIFQEDLKNVLINEKL